ncbi:hypothetical protein ACIU1J_19435 [Azospirillum doebereinerae]|uniref:hypothetical protein n=1 Tax=Azospirillum doebereinerae TaxID=92933 RepID=UPI001EE5FBBB|nr:hypothetical protein [Azospirillum doebereinerae]MCG5242291.1 hypothetical protein [Azospirillum doebereinerae]
MIAGTPSSSPPPGSIPPRPVTIHLGDRCSVAFEGYGTVEITGPRRGELAGMVSALPLVLKALVSVAAALRSGTALDLFELETALAEAGIAPGPFPREGDRATLPEPAPAPNRLADLLAAVAVEFSTLLQDRANFRAPRALKDALLVTVDTIRKTLMETGHGDPLARPIADEEPDAA